MLEHIAQTFTVSKAWVDGLIEDEALAKTVQLRFNADSGEEAASSMSPSWLKSMEILSEQACEQLGLMSSETICLMAPLDDCMSPTIPRQSIVLMDASVDQFVGNGVYCLRFGQLMTFRRMQHAQNGVIKVTSDNPQYSEGSFHYDPTESVSWAVCGKLLQVLPLVFRDL
ncbi:MAG: S24 family peptidase [Neisseriaceae bacterium]|nr:S24 family peptidase [Neisseriaceae bacterium]